MKTRISLWIVNFSILFSSALFGQKGIDDGSRYGHGDDSVRCVTNLSLYREYARQRDYTTAVKYWRIVFRECPTSSKNIYIDGVKIFRSFIEKEKDAEIQSRLIDTLMMVYDQRIQYYLRDKADQRGRQGVDLLRYHRNDDIKYIQQAYGYLGESIKLDKKESSEAVVATYFTSSLTLYQNGKSTQKKLIDDYVLCSDILEANLMKEPTNNTLKEIIAAQDQNFASAGVDCDSILTCLEPVFNKNKNDILNLKIITTSFKINGCTDNSVYFEASKNYYALAPSAESAANIASMAYDKGLYAEAVEFFKQATQLETEADTKSLYYLGLSKSLYKLNKKSDAREYALKASELKPDWGEPYIIIGQMYAESSDECTDLSLPKSIYWVAVDMFNKAKSVDPSFEEQANKFIILYTKYFPKKEDAFFLSLNEGDSYTVKCWINETTKVRF